MVFNKDSLIAKLQSEGVVFDVTEHAAAMTAEEQAIALSGKSGAVVKNLFLKDKRDRLLIICALEATKVDLAVLSARMGLGKGGIKMAPAELIGEVLKVPLGSVTPLAIANVDGSTVTVLLDQSLQSQSCLFVHPLVNTCSLGMSPSALGSVLRLFGQDAPYIDFEASPKIDRENPPDLSKYLPEPAAKAAATASTTTPTPAPAPTVKASTKAATKAAPKESVTKQHMKLCDVIVRTDSILSKLTDTLNNLSAADGAAKGKEAYLMSRLKADVETELNAIRNAAYAAGYMAGKGELVACAEKRFS